MTDHLGVVQPLVLRVRKTRSATAGGFLSLAYRRI